MKGIEKRRNFEEGKSNAFKFAYSCQYDLKILEKELKRTNESISETFATDNQEGYKNGLEEAIKILTSPHVYEVELPVILGSNVSTRFTYAQLPSQAMIDALDFVVEHRKNLELIKEEIKSGEQSVIQRLSRDDISSIFATPIIYQFCYLAGLKYAVQELEIS